MLSFFSKSWARTVAKGSSLASSKALVGAFWVILGTGGSQVFRLIGNLILTRLLFPEAFGIMALSHAVIIGLSQLSDVGLREGVVNSKRIGEQKFMQTAWTLQVAQSAFIAIAAVALAYPVANAYNEDILAPIICFIGGGLFLNGFKSICLLAYDKRLDLKTQIISNMVVQLVGLIVMIVWSAISPSVWALVGGTLVTNVLDVALSYILFKGHHSRFSFDKPAVLELFHFGKWIVLSSAISYLINQGDKLIMGIWLGMDGLGLYSLAATWSAILAMLSYSLSVRVLHPYFRNSLDEHNDFSIIHKARFNLNLAYTVVCVLLALLGDQLIYLLYDARYQQAGWMLQVLALGQIGRSLTGTLRPFLTARGDSYSQMKTSALSAILMVLFLMAGGWLSGAEGVIVAYALLGIAMHPIMIFFAGQHGYHCMKSDMGLTALAVLLVILGWWILDASVVQELTAQWLN